MIEITYKHFCDLCTKLIDVETHKLCYGPGFGMPQPSVRTTIDIGNGPKQLCVSCTAPVRDAYNKVIRDTLDARHPPNEPVKEKRS